MQQNILTSSERLISLSKLLSFNFTSAQQSPVLFNRDQNFVNVVLNRPQALNALDYEMIQLIKPKINEWNTTGVKAVYLTGTGGQSFCAGGDIQSLYEAKKAGGEKLKFLDAFFREEYTIDYQLAQMLPTQISVLDGIVMGGGVGLSANSPIQIATENSVFAMPQGKIGLFTDVGGGYFLSRMNQNIGRYLGLTGARIKGKELVQTGFANFYVPREKLAALETEIQAIVNGNVDVNQQALTQQLRSVVSKYSEDSGKGYKNQDLIDKFFSGNSLKEVFANLNKANTDKEKEFAAGVLQTLHEQNAISLHIIFQQIKRGQTLSLKDNFIMDFRLVNRFCEDSDFFEGVRCVLIDKTDKPKWNYKSYEEVPQSLVDQYFSNLPEQIELKL